MKKQILLFALLILCATSLTPASPLGTAFTYQGRLTDGGTAANGLYDLQFVLFDAATLGSAVGSTNSLGDIPVTNGLFTVLLDFGAGAFTGDARWLEIGVRPGASTGAFTTLLPRQPLAPTPYALFTPTAGGVPNGAITSNMLANGAVNSSKLATGAVTSVQLADTIALGATNVAGRLDIYRTAGNTPALTLLGSTSQLRIFGNDTQEKVSLDASPGWGQLLLHNSTPVSQYAAILTANGTGGGSLSLNNSNGQNRAVLFGGNGGGSLDLYQLNGGNGVSLSAASSQISTFGTDGQEQIRLWGPSWGEILLFDNFNNDNTVILGSGGGLLADSGGFLNLSYSNNAPRVSLQANAGGALLRLNNNSSTQTVRLDGSTGLATLSKANGSPGVTLDPAGSQISTFGSDGLEQIRLWGPSYGEILLNNSLPGNQLAVQLSANGSSGGTLSLNNSAGVSRALLGGYNEGGWLSLSRSDGTVTVSLDADDGSGSGLITTSVLQITGGSDLSEQFDVAPSDEMVQPGMVVCIAPENPGLLVVSTRAYDRTVAGIVSGAGGINPGMLMGHQGTLASGKHPIALTGRVYCLADASSRSIRPGDLLTTSATPGHAMKVTDAARAQGAILGKAMSALHEGKGLVLVLVSLQ